MAVTTAPFGEPDDAPVRLLREAGVAWSGNRFGRRLQAEEVAGVIGDAEVVVAGTEPIGADVMDACPRLRGICRVGIGLDSVDLIAAARRGIQVTYTPDAPSPAVAELTLGLMLDLLRGVTRADRAMRDGVWSRGTGRRLATATVGVIGVGRIGARVIRHLRGGFPGVRILANDLSPTAEFTGDPAVQWTDDKERIFRECDVVSLHVPLTLQTAGLVSSETLGLMKPSAVLVNTARGGVVDERALADALLCGRIAGAAVDVFAREPYAGPLTDCPTALLTCHMGSMTADCRTRMEVEATEDALRLLNGLAPRSPVPVEEYERAAAMRPTADVAP